MPASCAPGRCAGVGGGSEGGDDGCSPDPAVPRRGKTRKEGCLGGPRGEGKASSHTPSFPSPHRRARVQRSKSLSFPCPAAALSNPGSPAPALVAWAPRR